MGYLEGVLVGTVVFEGSFDSTDGVDGIWRTLTVTPGNASNTYTQVGPVAFTSTQSQSTYYILRTNGLQWVRMRVTAFTSGYATGVLRARNTRVY